VTLNAVAADGGRRAAPSVFAAGAGRRFWNVALSAVARGADHALATCNFIFSFFSGMS